MLKIAGLKTVFRSKDGRVQGVRGLDLQLGEGEFYTLLGPSGCGKTTTLRSIAGFESPDEGEISIDGEIVYSSRRKRFVPSHKRKLSMVFQSYAIWPHLNVFENVAYPLRYGANPRPDTDVLNKRVRHVLDLVRLTGMEEKPAPLLSGGQQQRVALARALIQNPRVMLLDEPLSNLDAALRAILRVEIRELLRSMGITAFYVTHDRLEALSMSDRVGIMKDGEIVQEGRPWDLYTAPCNSFVAAFMGPTNLFKGKIEALAPQSMAKLRATTPIGTIYCSSSEAVGVGDEVLLNVRPERVQVSKPNRRDSSENVFSGKIEQLVFLGESFDCRVRINNELLCVALPWTDRFSLGEIVDVVIQSSAFMVTKT